MDVEYVRVVWDGGMSPEEEDAATTRQWEAVVACLAQHLGWAAFDPDDGSGDIICAPASAQQMGKLIAAR